MKTALKSRKRKLISGKRAHAGPNKRAMTAIPVEAKRATTTERGDTVALYSVHDYARKPITIDATSPTFGDDLRRAFEKNVAKARRENKKKFGSPDPQPSKR